MNSMRLNFKSLLDEKEAEYRNLLKERENKVVHLLDKPRSTLKPLSFGRIEDLTTSKNTNDETKFNDVIKVKL
jgi:hypothetical protein